MVKLALLVALVGCSPRSADAPTPPPSGDAVYAQMLLRYGKARTYADHGDVTIRLTRDGKSQVEHRTFTTAFKRDDQLRFALKSDSGESADFWTNGKHAYVTGVLAGEGVVDFGTDIPKALDKCGDVATDAPYSLLGLTKLPTGLTVADDHGSWLLTTRATASAGTLVTEWSIDRTSYVVHRIKRQYTDKNAMSLELVTNYDAATIDAPVEAKALASFEIKGPIDLDEAPVWLGVMTAKDSGRVQQVVPGAPADTAGVKVGDELVSIDGHPIANGKDVVENARKLHADKSAPVVVKRGDATVPLTVVPKPRPDAAQVQTTFIGKAAAPFALPAVDGATTIELRSYRGSVVVLDFWATWCKPCLITTPHLEDLAKKFPSLGVIGISDEDRADVATHFVTHKPMFPQALDPGDKISRDYLIQGLPTIFVIDKEGVVRWASVGVPDFAELDKLIGTLVK